MIFERLNKDVRKMEITLDYIVWRETSECWSDFGAFRLVSLHHCFVAITPLQIICPGSLLTHLDALSRCQSFLCLRAHLCKLLMVLVCFISILCRQGIHTHDSCSQTGHEQNSWQLQLEHDQEPSTLSKMLTLSSRVQTMDFPEKSNTATSLLYLEKRRMINTYHWVCWWMCMQNFSLNKTNALICTYWIIWCCHTHPCANRDPHTFAKQMSTGPREIFYLFIYLYCF